MEPKGNRFVSSLNWQMYLPACICLPEIVSIANNKIIFILKKNSGEQSMGIPSRDLTDLAALASVDLTGISARAGRITAADGNTYALTLLSALSGEDAKEGCDINKLAAGLQRVMDSTDFTTLSGEGRTKALANIIVLQNLATTGEARSALDNVHAAALRSLASATWADADLAAAPPAARREFSLEERDRGLLAELDESMMLREGIFDRVREGNKVLGAIGAEFPEQSQPEMRCAALQVSLQCGNKEATRELAMSFLGEKPLPASDNLHKLLLAAYLQTRDDAILVELTRRVPGVSLNVHNDLYQDRKIEASTADQELGFNYGNLGSCYLAAAPERPEFSAAATVMKILNEAMADPALRIMVEENIQFPTTKGEQEELFQHAMLHKAYNIGGRLFDHDVAKPLQHLLHKRPDKNVSAEDLVEIKREIYKLLGRDLESRRLAARLLGQRLRLHSHIHAAKGGKLPPVWGLDIMRNLNIIAFGRRRPFKIPAGIDLPVVRALNEHLRRTT